MTVKMLIHFVFVSIMLNITMITSFGYQANTPQFSSNISIVSSDKTIFTILMSSTGKYVIGIIGSANENAQGKVEQLCIWETVVTSGGKFHDIHPSLCKTLNLDNKGDIPDLTISPDENFIAISNGEKIMLYSTPSLALEKIRVVRQINTSIDSMAWTESSEMLGVVYDSGEGIAVWDVFSDNLYKYTDMLNNEDVYFDPAIIEYRNGSWLIRYLLGITYPKLAFIQCGIELEFCEKYEVNSLDAEQMIGYIATSNGEILLSRYVSKESKPQLILWELNDVGKYEISPIQPSFPTSFCPSMFSINSEYVYSSCTADGRGEIWDFVNTKVVYQLSQYRLPLWIGNSDVFITLGNNLVFQIHKLGEENLLDELDLNALDVPIKFENSDERTLQLSRDGSILFVRLGQEAILLKIN